MDKPAPHPLDIFGQYFLLEIAESANPPEEIPGEFGDVAFPAKDGWSVTFFYDCGELDYIDHFVSPTGERLEVWPDDHQFGDQWPPLLCWRSVGDLKRWSELESAATRGRS